MPKNYQFTPRQQFIKNLNLYKFDLKVALAEGSVQQEGNGFRLTEYSEHYAEGAKAIPESVVAKLYGMSNDYIREMGDTGVLPYVSVHKDCRRYVESNVVAYFLENFQTNMSTTIKKQKD